MAIRSDNVSQRKVTSYYRNIVAWYVYFYIFCLSMTFAIFTWKSSASRDAESKLGRDKFFLFDVNMAGISMGEYSRRDDTRDSPLGWKMPVG